jgi:hypothetical protein
MARARNIKPALFKNEVLGVADPLLTLLFEGLWVLADRAGRLEDRPLRIRGEVFPYRDGLDVSGMLDWLQEAGFITRYKVAGASYIQVLNFEKHQNPHKNEPVSSLPGPDGSVPTAANSGITSAKIGTTPDSAGTTRADSLSSDSGSLKKGMQGGASLRLQWHAFVDRYAGPGGPGRTKRYQDWGRVFLNAAKGNWFRLWMFEATGFCKLTTAGIQAEIEHKDSES